MLLRFNPDLYQTNEIKQRNVLERIHSFKQYNSQSGFFLLTEMQDVADLFNFQFQNKGFLIHEEL